MKKVILLFTLVLSIVSCNNRDEKDSNVAQKGTFENSKSTTKQEDLSIHGYKKTLKRTLINFNAAFSENFVLNELTKLYEKNSETYYISHLTGDVNLDGKNDVLIYYGILGKDVAAQIGLGWCLVFSDNDGFAKNYLIFDWEEGTCAPNHHSIGVPIKIINGNIIARESFYQNDDPCCCPSFSYEETYIFSDHQLLLNSNTNNIIKPSKTPIK